ncbi:MAG TPA: AAA family ATPase [Acidiferrobacterales bacterium]
MPDQQNLALLIKSHFPLLVVETHEERRALDLLKQIAVRDGHRLVVWTATEGLKEHIASGASAPSAEGWRIKDDYRSAPDNPTLDPEDMLTSVLKHTRRSVIVLVDFHPYLTNPRIVRFLREIAQDYEINANTLVLVSHAVDLPDELKSLTARYELKLPDELKLRQMVLDEAKLWSLKSKQKLKADKQALELLIKNLRGLSLSDATRIVRNAIYKDNAITHSDIPDVQAAKVQLVGKAGILAFEHETAGFAELGGLRRLKDWLNKRRQPFLDAGNSRLDVPKGMLLLGVQGCGKSLAAKCVAGVWGVPLLRMDFAALYNKYIGETEKNIREALKAAQVLAPCVLWMDEIEKGVASGDDQTGTSRRVLGTLLTWMAENKAPVFLVATANDVQALPPELLRKGRVDEIFFVDLPDPATRQEILAVHLRKRDMKPEDFDLPAIAKAADGFSGAELEQAVVSARFAARADGQPVGSAHLLAEIAQTRPLSVLMAEQVNALRAWASGRTVPAD